MSSRFMIRCAFLLAVFCALAVAAFGGGWAVITLKEFPDHAVAGQTLNLAFTVRQHGVTLLGGLRPKVRATAAGGRVVEAVAAAGREAGEYRASLAFPQPGDWRVTITSGFNSSDLTLPALKVLEAGSAAPAPFSPMTRGLRLFTTKGCVGCHQHLEVTPESSAIAGRLDLTGKRFPSDYLSRFLADPSIKPAEMPNLKLTPEEIEMLAVFINRDSKKLKQEAAR
jgi:mono/diheme cytochrome c family protein